MFPFLRMFGRLRQWKSPRNSGRKSGHAVCARPWLEALERRLAPAAVPTVSLLGTPSAPLLGESVPFTVRFDNTSATDTGYGPYADLYLPTTGADGAGAAVDDGITFVSASYLGQPVQATVLTLTAAGVPHPFAKDASGNPVTILPPAGFREGDQLVVLQVPYGSFTPAQPPADIVVTTALSNLADVNTPLPLRAQGGFRFGNDPLDNPTTDPSLSGPPATASVTPALFTLSKTYIGPEDETATGPNFPQAYRISVDIANGQTITNLDLTDVLPPQLQFIALTSTSGPTTDLSTPSTTTTGGTLTRQFASVTGTTGAIDAQMTFSFYVPRISAPLTSILDPATGDDATAVDDASAQGQWTPIDPRDPPTPVSSDVTANDHTLTLKSIATQKSSSIVNDTGAPGLTPGDTVEYTINFQVSDYFAFQNLVLNDLFSDGQEYVPGSATLFVSDGHTTSGTTSGAFAGSNVALTPNISGGSDQLLFAVSQELADRGFSPNGRLVGGAIPSGGTGVGPPPSAPPLPFGPTQGTIRFRTIIQDSYQIDFPSGDPALDQGDPISDNVTISGDLLNVTDLVPNGNTESDDSSSSNNIQTGAFTKTVYAIDGVLNPPPTPGIAPGDTVTYQLHYTLPTGDVENLVFRDFLPLPIFDVDTTGKVTGFDDVVSGAVPATGRAQFGPTDTFRALTGIVPTVSLDSGANSVTFTYGTYDDPTNTPVTIDILFTVTVSDDPFADQLLLSNGAEVESNNTVLESVTGDGIAQVVLQEPLLSIKKGVVATDNPAGIFTPAMVAPVTFNAPGTLGPRFTGTITSAALAATPINSNLGGVDDGDLVTFAITVVNSGSSPKGAFDVFIDDSFPTGFVAPGLGAETINLHVTDGAGRPMAYRVTGGSIAGGSGGIELLDPAPDRGAIGPAATDGSDVVVITYDLRLANNNVLDTLTNVGEVTSYAGQEGGPDFTGPDSLTDPAVVVVGDDNLLAKRLVGTEIVNANNSNTDAVVGEFVTYQVTIKVPEATMPGAILTDTLDEELAFVALDSAVLSSGVSITGSTTPVVINNGRDLLFNFGDITNSNTDNAVPETITLTYRAVVVDTAASQANDLVNNSARFTFTGLSSPLTAAAANVRIIEPQVQIAKSVSVNGAGNTGDAGDPFVYTIVLSNPPGANQFTADAFDLTFSDLLQSGLLGSPLNLTGFTVTDTLGLVTAANFELATDPSTGQRVLQTTPTGAFDLPVNASRTITIQVSGILALTLIPGQVIPNSAEVRWTSLPGDPGQRSAFSPNSTERTGADGPGGVNDYLASDGADINILNLALNKSVVTTSENATTDPAAVVVGEIVRYRVQVAIPEFGTPTSFQFVDLLPAGMDFITGSNGLVALVTDAGDHLISSTLMDPDPLPPDLYLTGNEFNVAMLVPQFPIPSNILSFATVNGRSQVTFDLGLVTNPPEMTGNDLEFLVAEFNVLVTNVATNQSGTVLVNQVTTLENGAPTETNVSPALRVAEPAITGVDKTVVSLLDRDAPQSGLYDAGDRVRYRVGYDNDVGADVSTAYDVRLVDALPSVKMTLDPTSIVVFRNGVQLTEGFTIAPGGNTVDVTVAEVAPGDAIAVFYEVTLTVAVEAGELIPNTANLTWTSLPGDNGTPSNPTGSTTPGAPGSATGERDGSGGINDYAVSDTEFIEILSPQLTKSIVDSSSGSTDINQFNPALTDLAIGEQVLYEFTITLPEGTTHLVFTDQLPFGANGVVAPIGFELLFGDPGSFAVPGAQVVTTAVDTDGDGINDRFTIDFGTLVNPPDGVVNNSDRIIFGLRAQVLDVPQNVAGKTVTNTATIDWGQGTVSDSVTAEIVEPVLNVTKSAVAVNGSAVDDTLAPPPVDAGDLVTYRVTVQHAPSSTSFATDLVLTDALPAGLQLIAGSQTIVAAPDYSAIGVAPPTFQITGNTLTFNAAFLDHPASLLTPGSLDEFVIEYQARVTTAANPGDTITNTQTLTYRSYAQTAFTVYPNDSRPYTASDPAAVVVNSNSIAGVIYIDRNNNGIYEPGSGETLVTSSVDVELTGFDNLNNPVTRTVTTTTGNYTFTGLRPGTYAVREVTQPPTLLDGRDTPGTSSPGAAFGGTGTAATDARNPRDSETISNIVIGTGGSKSGINYNFGELQPSSIGDFVWQDLNGNGVQDAGEPGIPGVSVSLSGTDDTGRSVSQSTTSGAGGVYAFTMLRPGTYFVTFGNNDGAITYTRTVQDSPQATSVTDSDGNVATGATLAIVLSAGQDNDIVDQGLYVPVTLGNRVYYDINGDGVQDPGEPGIPGAAVSVVWLGPDGVVGGGDDQTFNTTTGADGIWSVPNLPPGSYQVTATPTAASGFNTLTDSIDNNLLSATNPVIVSTTSGVNRNDIDFGFRGTGSIGDRVWYDLDRNGVQGANEPGIANVTVTVVWFGFDGLENTTADNITFVRTTNLAGLYSVLNLPLGGYRVTVDVSTVPPTPTATYDLDSGTTNPDSTTLVALTAARPTEPGADFGYFVVPFIGDTVWLDFNGDGVQDNGEPGLPNVTLTALFAGNDGLFNGIGDIAFTTTTDANGLYAFTAIPPGRFRVSVTGGLPAGVTQTGDPDGTLDGQTELTIAGDEVRDDIDFGYRGPSALGNFVWQDLNGNGRQDPGEPGSQGVTVQLTHVADGALWATTTTDPNGLYSFPGLIDGQYTIRFVAPAGNVFTVPNLGDDLGDSDADPSTGVTAQLALGVGVTDNSVDAGLYRPLRIGDFVWYDIDGDAVQDAGEPGIPGATVTVTWLGPDGVAGGGDDQPFQATTDASGIYHINNLPPGNYTAAVSGQPAGLTVQTTTLSSFTLVSGVDRDDIDFGFRGAGSISGFVYLDLDNDGIFDAGETPLQNVAITLTGMDALGVAVNRTLPTQANGSYSFTNLAAGTYVLREPAQPAGLLDGKDTPGTPFGGTALPPLGDTIAGLVIPVSGNVTGINYNFGELPPAAVGDFVWEDRNGNGRQDLGEPGLSGVIVTLTGTDDLGPVAARTTTTNMLGAYGFDNLRPGSYTATFTLPSGYVFTVRDSAVASDSRDSDADPTTGQAPFPLGVGQQLETIDAGMYRPAALGDRVWLDQGGDGVQDAGEPGIPGLTVTATWFGPDGAPGGGDDRTFSTTTAGNGLYTLTGLPPGGYQVAVSGLSGGLTPTFDLDGTATPSTAALALVSGGVRTDVDFGYRGPGSIGDRVWYDVNQDGTDAGESGIAGVTILARWFGLDGAEGTADDVVLSAVTGSDGRYQIVGLPLGGYRVAVDPNTLPPDRRATFDLDSGTVNPDGVTAVTLTLLTRDETRADFGYTGTAAIGDRVWLDFNGNGVQDPDEPGIPDVTVTAVWAGPDGDLNTTAENATLTTVTGANGLYQFVNIPSGVYRVAVTGGLPAGVTNTGDPDGTFDSVTAFGLALGQVRSDIDFGYRGDSSLAGFVYRDFSVDGIRQPTGVNPETGIAGVVVTLTGADSIGHAFTRTTVTGADGSYAFTGLPAGSYAITETQPPSVFVAGQTGFYDGLDTPGSAGGSSSAKNQLTVLLGVGQAGIEYDFGENPPADPFGFVYIDLNNNGIREAGEPGVAGVPVTVSGAAFAGTALTHVLTAADIPGGNLTVLTDSSGRWEFPIMPPGVYSFVETQPADLLDGLEQDADPNGPPALVGNDRFDNVVLDPFPVRGPFNFGEIANNASLAGFVYMDFNNNGVRDVGEQGIAGVTVTLTGGDVTGQSVAATIVTDGTGAYAFVQLRAGTYTLTETQPPQFFDGKDTQGTPGTGTTGNDQFVNIVLGTNVAGAENNFGELAPATLSGFVFLDNNSDNKFQPELGEKGLPKVVVSIKGVGDPSVTTAADGSFTFTNLPPGSYVLTETLPPGYLPGTPTPGTAGGTVASNVQITAIALNPGTVAPGYLFPVGLRGALDGLGGAIAPPGIVGPVVPPDFLGKVELLGSSLADGATGDLTGYANYVNGLYHDVLGRVASTGDVNFWVKQLLGGEARAQVSAEVWTSPEHRGLQVDQFYQQFLHHDASNAGRAYWVNVFLSGATETDVAVGFLTSQEYLSRPGGVDAFVASVYREVLGRLVDPAGRAYWAGGLKAGTLTYADVARGIVTSDEASFKTMGHFYANCLHRPLDAAGAQFWVDELRRDQSPTLVAEQLLASDEYFSLPHGATT